MEWINNTQNNRYIINLENNNYVDVNGYHRYRKRMVLFDTHENKEIQYNDNNLFEFCLELNRDNRATKFEDDMYLEEIHSYVES